MVNVPTAVLIDERGVMVRYDEDAYSKVHSMGTFEFGNDRYRPVVLDWAKNGAESPYVQSAAQVTAHLSPSTKEEAAADPYFRLGVYFYAQDDAARANTYWDKAQELNPDSWNYHRQDWSFLEPAETNRNWLSKVQSLNGRPYYRPSLPDE